MTPDGKEVQLVVPDCAYPNELVFTPDESQMYVNDTRLGLIRIFDVNHDGTLGPGRLFHTLQGSEAGVADGVAVW